MGTEIFVYLTQIMLSLQYCAMFSQAIRDTAHTQKYTPHMKRDRNQPCLADSSARLLKKVLSLDLNRTEGADQGQIEVFQPHRKAKTFTLFSLRDTSVGE